MDKTATIENLSGPGVTRFAKSLRLPLIFLKFFLVDPTMKPDPISDHMLSAAQTKSWSLSWKPEGRCGQFTREAILASAPAASGVYGLFNFDCQIFIGESADIRAILLRLESETDFQSQHLRPTGFTFELCPEDSRKQKAAALIAQYRPALQTIPGGNDFPAHSAEFMGAAAETSRPEPEIEALA